jgi:Phage ABA sandwich domain
MQSAEELIAGREFDALIAEKVMGWPGDGLSASPTYREQNMPHFSTDIAAAWQIIERAREFDLWFNPDQRHWGCYLAFPSGFARVDADNPSAPLAICRAALAAVSHD